LINASADVVRPRKPAHNKGMLSKKLESSEMLASLLDEHDCESTASLFTKSESSSSCQASTFKFNKTPSLSVSLRTPAWNQAAKDRTKHSIGDYGLLTDSDRGILSNMSRRPSSKATLNLAGPSTL